MPRGSNYRPAAQAELAGWDSRDRLEFRYSADHAQEGSVSSFDVRVFAIRRRPGRRVFEVRWRVAGGDKSRSFITRALADSYRAELIRAARRGLEFDPATGEPQAWAAPAPATVTWYQHAVAYAAMKWPHLAAFAGQHGRGTGHRHPAADQNNQPQATGPDAAGGPVRVCVQPAAALTRTRAGHRQRACLAGAQLAAGQPSERPAGHPGCPGRAVRAAGRLTRGSEHHHPQAGGVPQRPRLRGRTRPAARQPGRQGAVARTQGRRRGQPPGRRQSCAGPGPTGPGRSDAGGPGGVLRLPVLRGAAPRRSRRSSPKPSLPARGRGAMILTGACPRTGTAWTSNGRPHEPRGLKHRPTGTVRIVPIPPILVCLLRQHIRESGTALDGRLFHGTRGGPLSESVYGRVWHAARQPALGPAWRPPHWPAAPTICHAALSFWLNASGAPAEVA